MTDDLVMAAFEAWVRIMAKEEGEVHALMELAVGVVEDGGKEGPTMRPGPALYQMLLRNVGEIEVRMGV